MMEEKFRKEIHRQQDIKEENTLSKSENPWSSSNRGSPAYNKGQIKEATSIGVLCICRAVLKSFIMVCLVLLLAGSIAV
jgi:hypothetical protein